ncbi:histidine kinase [Actinomadura sp. DC4]|uniref:sensor histidine kinase n=1 Tax=Actinomadura sp. DC4 TaxID=3055069 RepID=UPI00339D5FDB
MHDVVAHSLTLFVVRAETVRARGGQLPEWARTQVDGLALAGRQAGGELRVLRGPEDAAPLQPMPGLGDLPDLLDRSRAAGAWIDARIEVETDTLPRPAQLTCYRIVQESLTNARRHAPGAPVRVTVAEDAGRLRCEVVNAPPTGPAAPGRAVGALRTRPPRPAGARTYPGAHADNVRPRRVRGPGAHRRRGGIPAEEQFL